ncbi:hypothetical protein E5288_WYG013127 [Bos mutus]|uniref:Uncharacterized protein n=1 Tax=Bos mutus TaxID=72004 RepID=A0A6B0RDF9_9CETA|nr:hypothetical protein [Bos mutus]
MVILLPWGLVQGPVMVWRPFSHFLQLILVLLSHIDSLPLFFSGSFPDQKEAVTYKLKGLCQHLSSAPNLREQGNGSSPQTANESLFAYNSLAMMTGKLGIGMDPPPKVLALFAAEIRKLSKWVKEGMLVLPDPYPACFLDGFFPFSDLALEDRRRTSEPQRLLSSTAGKRKHEAQM